jgi:murein DD-endopeptidase MepM/ murein hydrolase activator NlpD
MLAAALGLSALVTALAPAVAQTDPPLSAPPPRPLPTVAPAPTTAPPQTAPPQTSPPATSPPATSPPPTSPPPTSPPPTSPPATAPPADGTATTTTTTPDTASTTSTTAPGSTGGSVTAPEGGPPPAGDGAATNAATGGPPPPSLSSASVSSILGSFARSTAVNSTSALIGALQPLKDYGFSTEQALMVGMGRFPVGGEAYFRDDFGDPRETPVPHSHQGTDIFAAFDTPVRSPADGVVHFATEPVGGRAAYVTEPDGTWYYMAHLKAFAPGLASGSTVRTGQVVGFNGDTGNAQGGAPHVHFEIHPRGGAAVNPKPFLDRWLADAIAAVPALLAPFRMEGVRPITSVGLARHLDQGILAAPPRLGAPAATMEGVGDLATALVTPLTPTVLRDLRPSLVILSRN